MELTKWKRGELRAPSYKIIAVRLNENTDQDIIQALEQIDNTSGYIKALIRRDLEGGVE